MLDVAPASLLLRGTGVSSVFVSSAGDRSVDIAGIAMAAALLLLARALLPVAERARVRLPLTYFLLALLFGGLTAAGDSAASLTRVFHFLYTFFLLASCGCSVVLLAVDVIFGRRTHRAPPRIFRDLTQAIAYVIVAMLTLRAVGVEPGSLLTTSALLTAVIGLALQDTLGNMVSGLALQMQRPFEVGDWIQFESDARQIGQVTEVNWRATTVITNDLVELIVPNALLAKAAIRNYSRPSPVSRRTVVVQGPYGVSPKRVQEAILGAIQGVAGVLAEPHPVVLTRSFADSGIEYAVQFFTNDFAGRERVEGAVRDRIWYAFQRAAIDVPFPTRMVHAHDVSEAATGRTRQREIELRDQALRYVDFLDVLPAEAHAKLAAAADVRFYGAGELIVAQGDRSAELYVIERGEVAVELTRDGQALQVARLGAHKFFGEMGLMTGEARTASVRAITECQILVIGYDAFHGALASEPGIVEKMSEFVAKRQAQLEALAAVTSPREEPMQERSRRLISQIKDFFKL